MTQNEKQNENKTTCRKVRGFFSIGNMCYVCMLQW